MTVAHYYSRFHQMLGANVQQEYTAGLLNASFNNKEMWHIYWLKTFGIRVIASFYEGERLDGEWTRHDSTPGCNRLHKLCNLYRSIWTSSCSQCVVPLQCRWCEGSCCLDDRERSTGGRSLDEAARRAAGSCRLPNTRPGGRSVCSGGFHMAVFCCMSSHRKCPAGDTGCCCVAVGQKKRASLLSQEIKKKKNRSYANDSSGELPRAFPCTISEWGRCKVDTSLHCGSCETLKRDKCWENIHTDGVKG